MYYVLPTRYGCVPLFSSCRHTIRLISHTRTGICHPTFLFFQTQVEDINLVRDEDTGKSKGFAFMKYEDSRSCILAVDNLTGSKVRQCFVQVLQFCCCANSSLPFHVQMFAFIY